MPNLQVVLYEPEIAPNVGNIGRICAATGISLHLVGRLGFRLNDRTLKRAGLDYWPHVELHQHTTWEEYLEKYPLEGQRIFALSAHATKLYTEVRFQAGDRLLFGSESRGLPARLLQSLPTMTIPMPSGKVRSLNLANSVAIVVYEAIRQGV